MMHTGRTNKTREYPLNGRTLGNTEDQRDIDVHVHRSLKVVGQVDKVVKKAYGILVFIN